MKKKRFTTTPPSGRIRNAVGACASFLGAIVSSGSGRTSVAAIVLALLLAPVMAHADAYSDNQCGHLGQRACKFWEHFPSCPGLVEYPFGHCSAPPRIVQKVIHDIAYEGRKITQTALNDIAKTATQTYQKTVSGTTNAYNNVRDSLNQAVNGVKDEYQNSANQALNKWNTSINGLSSRMKDLKSDAAALAALNRIVRSIEAGHVNIQARQDMLTLGDRLGLMAGRANTLFPNIKNSSWGVFVEHDITVSGITYAENYALVMATQPGSGGVIPMGLVYTVGGALSSPSDPGGETGQIGILWQPGPVDNAGGGQVGMGGSAGPVSVGVSWSVAKGMEKDGPKGAIPGFSLAFSGPCCDDPISFSPSLNGGYSQLIAQWQGTPVAPSGGSGDIIYYATNDHKLLFYRLDPGATNVYYDAFEGNKWQFAHDISGGPNGEMWVLSGNTLLYYRHNANLGWPVQHKHVGSDWGGMTKIFAAGDYLSGCCMRRVLFALDHDWNVWYYNFHEARDGTFQATGRIVGDDFKNFFKRVFVGTDGYVYGIKRNGDLLYYRYDLRTGRLRSSGNGTLIGTGWNNFTQVFGGKDGMIFAVSPDGHLLGYRRKKNTIYGPQILGSGWHARLLSAEK